MLTLSLTGCASVELLEVASPRPGLGEEIVEVDLVGICGSEVDDSKTLTLRRPPLVMGHEIVGRLPGGTRVVVDPLIPCGTCRPCRSGRGNICDSREVIGIHRPGGFAAYVAVPSQQILPISPVLPDRQAVMVEPLANGLHSWRLSGASAESRVGIIGAGPIGLSVVLVAVAHGAGSIHVAELNEARQRAAAEVGAETDKSLHGQYDVIFDCVGSAESRQQSTRALVDGGTGVWLGLREIGAVLNGSAVVRGEKVIRGAYGYTHGEFVGAVSIASQVPSAWVEERPMSEGPFVFESLWRGDYLAPKIALRPNASRMCND